MLRQLIKLSVFWRTKKQMLITDAKTYVGQFIQLQYHDRKGEIISERVEVFDVNFIPLYGPCLITDIGDIRLDRVSNIKLFNAVDEQVA